MLKEAAAMEKRKYVNTDMDVNILGFGGTEIGSSDERTVDRLLKGLWTLD
ncbi:hypothetical protein J2T20_002642 [Paenibacillus wynnii]|nr:hypothetical protein [Paenibacillus wynnii]